MIIISLCVRIGPINWLLLRFYSSTCLAVMSRIQKWQSHPSIQITMTLCNDVVIKETLCHSHYSSEQPNSGTWEIKLSHELGNERVSERANEWAQFRAREAEASTAERGSASERTSERPSALTSRSMAYLNHLIPTTSSKPPHLNHLI